MPQRTLVELATQTWLYLRALDASLMRQPTLVDARRRAVLPGLRERTDLADFLLRCLRTLGLERRRKSVDLEAYLATRYAARGAPQMTEAVAVETAGAGGNDGSGEG